MVVNTILKILNSKLLFLLFLSVTLVMVGGAWLYIFLDVDTVIDVIGSKIYILYSREYNEYFEELPLLVFDRELFKRKNVLFLTHVSVSSFALLIGIFQFIKTLRKKYQLIHQICGYIYLFSCLIGISSGIFLGMDEYAGMLAALGFLGMGGSTIICTVQAFICIFFYKNYKEHYKWTLRSYYIMWSSVIVFRFIIALVIPKVIEYYDPDTIQEAESLFRDAYSCAIFLSWSVPIILADLYMSYTNLTTNTNNISNSNNSKNRKKTK
eukprot:TRINITY_DN349_c2_g2_i1.p1 TRINITY_DN349_c2_g2~~TRINITY_DN349_c2_g2_i1.p1  ORF type:complete len:267 (-),score=48.13 TRINITY_DN349_c2_g2_i1:151-951(-)